MKLMSLRNEVVSSGLRRANRASAKHRHEEGWEGLRELDGRDLELLSGELAEPGAASEPASYGADYSEPTVRHTPPSGMKGPAHAWDPMAGDIADSWMVHGGKAPLLTPAQEIVLAKRAERGDLRAKEELVNANVRLVASVARRYQNRGLPLEDLMQEGLIGLLRAIDKYNYRKGYRFSTYATHWIRQAVTRGLANQGRSIRLPAHVVDAIGRVARIREELFQATGNPPTRAEIAAAAGISEKKLTQLLRSAVEPMSLDTPLGEDGESYLGDFIPAGADSSPADRAFHLLVHEELQHALNTLTPREKEVVALRFGLSDEETHTLEETGRRLHITRERVRQIENKALEKLRHPHIAGRLREAAA